MATIYTDVTVDVEIEVGEFLEGCSSREIEELVTALREGGWLTNTPSDDQWEQALDKLSGFGRSRLSVEDEQTILKIASKL